MTTLNRDPFDGTDHDESIEDTDNKTDADDSNQDLDSGDDEIEARARRMGWLPEDEWDDERAEKQGRRKPAKFITAREYIENAENSLPMLRSHLRNMDAKLNEANKQTAEVYSILQEQRQLSVAAIERARKEEREKLLKEREEAFDAGDKKTFQEVEAKIEELDANNAPAADKPGQQQQRSDPPEVAEFRRKNPWFTTDARLTNNLIEEFEEVKTEKPDLSFGEKMEEAKRRLMKRFPEKFGINPRREAARTSVHTPTGGRDDNSVETRFARLSTEEKSAWERVRKMVESRGGKITKGDWMKEIGR